MLQGGDFENSDGTGGESIYGKKFDDENFKCKHLGRGYLSCANSGPNTNGSQFFITFKDTEWLDGKHVVFGFVRKNLEYLDILEKQENDNSKPKEPITIVDCGEIDNDQIPIEEIPAEVQPDKEEIVEENKEIAEENKEVEETNKEVEETNKEVEEEIVKIDEKKEKVDEEKP